MCSTCGNSPGSLLTFQESGSSNLACHFDLEHDDWRLLSAAGTRCNLDCACTYQDSCPSHVVYRFDLEHEDCQPISLACVQGVSDQLGAKARSGLTGAEPRSSHPWPFRFRPQPQNAPRGVQRDFECSACADSQVWPFQECAAEVPFVTSSPHVPPLVSRFDLENEDVCPSQAVCRFDLEHEDCQQLSLACARGVLGLAGAEVRSGHNPWPLGFRPQPPCFGEMHGHVALHACPCPLPLGCKSLHVCEPDVQVQGAQALAAVSSNPCEDGEQHPTPGCPSLGFWVQAFSVCCCAAVPTSPPPRA